MDQHKHIENDKQYIGLTVNGGVAQPPSSSRFISPKSTEVSDSAIRGAFSSCSLESLLKSSFIIAIMSTVFPSVISVSGKNVAS